MRILLSCGGTGGHIYPAIAIADRIRELRPDADLLFIGAKHGMEKEIVPEAGYAFEGIDASSFNRKNLLKNFKSLYNIYRGGREADAIMDAFSPNLAIGTGAYVTGIVLRRAAARRLPYYIQEQNAVPGMTNKLLARGAEKIFISFEASRKAFKYPGKCVLSGNPLRSGFVGAERDASRAELGLQEETMILATGGSLGAEALNRALLSFVRDVQGRNIKLFFVTGRRYFDTCAAELANIPGAEAFVRLMPYADNMPVLMSAADIVVSRAGALILSEIAVSGKPSLLIPSPNVTNNHQYHNAKALAEAGAAVLIEEEDLSSDSELFSRTLISLLENTESLAAMSRASLAIGCRDAADIIIKEMGI